MRLETKVELLSREDEMSFLMMLNKELKQIVMLMNGGTKGNDVNG